MVTLGGRGSRANGRLPPVVAQREGGMCGCMVFGTRVWADVAGGVARQSAGWGPGAAPGLQARPRDLQHKMFECMPVVQTLLHQPL